MRWRLSSDWTKKEIHHLHTCSGSSEAKRNVRNEELRLCLQLFHKYNNRNVEGMSVLLIEKALLSPPTANHDSYKEMRVIFFGFCLSAHWWAVKKNITLILSLISSMQVHENPHPFLSCFSHPFFNFNLFSLSHKVLLCPLFYAFIPSCPFSCCPHHGAFCVSSHPSFPPTLLTIYELCVRSPPTALCGDWSEITNDTGALQQCKAALWPPSIILEDFVDHSFLMLHKGQKSM